MRALGMSTEYLKDGKQRLNLECCDRKSRERPLRLSDFLLATHFSALTHGDWVQGEIWVVCRERGNLVISVSYYPR